MILYASEVAIITGENTFEKMSNFVLKLWQRYNPTDFQETVAKLNLKTVPIKTDRETLDAIASSRNVNLKRDLDSCLKSSTVAELSVNKTKVMKKFNKKTEDDKKIIDNFLEKINKETDKKVVEKSKQEILKKFVNEETKKEVKKVLEKVEKGKAVEAKKVVLKKFTEVTKKEKAEVKKSLDNFGNRNFGIKSESDAVKYFENVRKEKVILDNGFYKKVLFNNDGTKWYIGGRVDGKLEDGTIVEIKNRVYRLFYRLRNYERTQIQSYMYIFDVENAVLVEFLKKGEGIVNIIDVEFNDEKFEAMREKVKSFSDLFMKIMRTDKMKAVLVKGSESDREALCNAY